MNERIPIAKPYIGEAERAYVSECLEKGDISSNGYFVSRFEEINKTFYSVSYCIAVSNGTAALHLALEALDITWGDEVIVPGVTFASTANAVLKTGAELVLADIDRTTWTIDVTRLDELVTDRTKAIIVVHLYGQPCDMDAICAFSREHNLFIIEDCAEAHGARFNDKQVGSFGIINCFSFFGNKVITTGEGGICLTNNKDLARKIRLLRDHGMSKNKRYWHDVIGFNYRMTNLQAALGCGQMERVDQILIERDSIARRYDQSFAGVEAITLQSTVPMRKKICWLYTILLDDSTGHKRDRLIDWLEERNIESRPMFFPLHEMPPYRAQRTNNLMESSNLTRRGVSLPTYEGLQDEKIERICQAVIEFVD